MTHASSIEHASRAQLPPVRVGALAPLSPPGWVDAGRNLLAGLELGVADVNRAGGVGGRPIELLVRDTAADPSAAADAVAELDAAGVAGLVGEYHSVVARAVANRADALRLPFLCSSAVLDELAASETSWVARLATPQSRGWSAYADVLIATGVRRVVVVAAPGLYWTTGTAILRERLAHNGGSLREVPAVAPDVVCDRLADDRPDAVLLLVGHPEPVVPLVRAIRRDARLAELRIGAPAGQPELADWLELLGTDGCAVPFLRYRPASLTELGDQVDLELTERLGRRPSFVGLEGYDAALVLADVLAATDGERPHDPPLWQNVAVNGTRGCIGFSRLPGAPVLQWPLAPIQIAQRDPARPERFQVLHNA